MNHFNSYYFYQQVVSAYEAEQTATRSPAWPPNDSHQNPRSLRNSVSHAPSIQNDVSATQGDMQQSQYPLQLPPIQYQFSQQAMYASDSQTQQPPSSEWLMQQPWPTVYQHHMDFQPVPSAPNEPDLPQYQVNEMGDQSMIDFQPQEVEWTEAPAQPMYPEEQLQEMKLQPTEAGTSHDMIPLTSFQQNCSLAKQRARANWTTKKEEWSDKELLEYFHEATPEHLKAKEKKRRRLRPQLPTPDDVE